MRHYIRRYTIPPCELLHQQLTPSISLPVSTSPQLIHTIDLSSAISAYVTRHSDPAQSPGAPVPLRLSGGTRIFRVTVLMHLTRQTTGSATVYYGVSEITSSSTNVSPQLSITLLSSLHITETNPVIRIYASQSASVGFELFRISVYISYSYYLVDERSMYMWSGSDIRTTLHAVYYHLAQLSSVSASLYYPQVSGALNGQMAVNISGVNGIVQSSSPVTILYTNVLLSGSLLPCHLIRSPSIVDNTASAAFSPSIISTAYQSSTTANQFWIPPPNLVREYIIYYDR